MFQPGANLYTQGFGSRPENVEVPHYDSRAPTAQDILYPIGKQWVWSSNQQIWELVQITSAQGVTSAVWVQLTNQSTGANTTYEEDNGTSAHPIGNVLHVIGGNGIQTTGDGNNTITIDVVGDGFKWNELPGPGPYNLSVQNGYYCNTGMTVNLPAGSVLGDTIVLFIDTSSDVIVTAAGGDYIQVGNQLSSVGGTMTSTTLGAVLQLNYRPFDTTWHTIASMGTWIPA